MAVVTESLLAFALPEPLSHGILLMTRTSLSSSSLSGASSGSGRLDFDGGGGGMGKLRLGPTKFLNQRTRASSGHLLTHGLLESIVEVYIYE